MKLKSVAIQLFAVGCILLSLTLSSCSKEEHAQVAYSLFCTEDVLDHVQPEISYTDAGGHMKTIKLTKDDFVPTKVVDEKTRATIVVPKYTVAINYDDLGKESECSVSFTKLESHPADKSIYAFYAKLFASVIVVEEKGGTTNIWTNTPIEIDNTKFIMNRDEFDSAIDDLITNGLSLKVKIESKGKITFD